MPPAECLCLDTKKQEIMLQFFFICGKNLKNIFAALPGEGVCLDTKKQRNMLQFVFICGENYKKIFAVL